MIAPSEPVGEGFLLVHAPTGQPLAAAPTPLALRTLARTLAWFDPAALDPDYLADPANAGVAASVHDVLRQWVLNSAERVPLILRPPADNTDCGADSAWLPTQLKHEQ